MKKLLVSLLAIAMLAVTLTGCTTAKTYKYGVGINIKVTGASAVPAAGEVAAKDGNYAVNTDVVTVVLDKDNKVVSATWDVAQSSRLNFDVTGTLKVDLTKYSMKTKAQKGTEYGMTANCQTGQICKEWNVQSKFFTDFLVGKTVDQVKAIEMVDGKAKDAAIKVGTTVTISGFFPAFEKAVANAVEAKKVAKFGVGIDIKVTGASVVPAAGEVAAKDGNYAINTDVVTVLLDKNDKVISAFWDVAQTRGLNFDATGTLKVDLATYVMKTKVQKGAAYGMTANCQTGQICKEWNVQSKFFTDFIVGKTVAQVKAIEVVEGYAKDTAIKAGTTVRISSFFPAFDKAVANTVVIK
ncbi:MAG: hypothetical protein FD179_250 [Erysipelotrichaceae bacterium]|nr:MAG: hypothetical protein FD179_250 [Erysipelotrichaceae bacterium]